MSYFRTCPRCGAHLDPGEVCDCREDLRDQLKEEILSMTEEECTLLLQSWRVHQQHPELTTEECLKRAALGAANTESGGVERDLTGPISAPIVTENVEVCKL